MYYNIMLEMSGPEIKLRAVIFLSLLGRGLSPLILGNIIAKIADLGSKKAGLSSDFWENCMIL
jgi:hypothetical protein